MSGSGYRQRRKVSKRSWKERAGFLQQHAAMTVRLINAFMLDKTEPVTFSGEMLEQAKGVNVQLKSLPDGGLELTVAKTVHPETISPAV